MPLYEFTCTVCRHRFEHRARVDDRMKPQCCPQCGGTAQKAHSVPTAIVIAPSHA